MRKRTKRRSALAKATADKKGETAKRRKTEATARILISIISGAAFGLAAAAAFITVLWLVLVRIG